MRCVFLDPRGIEPLPPQCECGILPLYYGPVFSCPQKELNLHHSLRTGLLYPLSYGGQNTTTHAAGVASTFSLLNHLFCKLFGLFCVILLPF